MRQRRSRFSSDYEEIAINLTPLIDVVFVVLIMFIIIAPMLEKDRVELAAAAKKEEKEPATVQDSSPVAIHVHADNTIWIQGQRIDERQLLSCLAGARERYPQKTPQLFQDKKAQFGTYQMVKNAVEGAGFEHLDIILQP